MHRWWARRPLAACRAFIYASLVDDPDDDGEREELLKEVADLASWDAVRKPEQVVRSREGGGSGLTGAQLLRRARQRILDCNDGKPPRLLDPFAGGGAIPLEALRLGCEVEASDLNPVAVLILKGTVEYPQKYGRPLAEQVEQRRRGERDSIAGVDGKVPEYIRHVGQETQSTFGESDAVAAYEKNPLAADVRYWGRWMLERARAELAPFYPPDPDGSVPVAYLWSRTVPCPNCGAEMPLIRQYWLARTANKNVALKPVLDFENKRVDFEVVEGANVTGDFATATNAGGDTICLLCRQVVTAKYVRQAGLDGKIRAMLTAVVLEAKGGRGKRYRADAIQDLHVFEAAVARLTELEAQHDGDLPLVPDEPIASETLGLRVDAFGLDRWGKLFNSRQLLALTTFARLVRVAYTEMGHRRLDQDYGIAVVTYLGLSLDRMAAENSTLTRWNSSGPKAQGAMALQALSFVWDYAELNPWGNSVGDAFTSIRLVESVISFIGTDLLGSASISMQDASVISSRNIEACITDPPYYNSIDYAGLSDFFYVWLKRSLGTNVYPNLMFLPLTPKKEQAIMASETESAAARQRYVQLMAKSFDAISQSVERDGLAAVVFAHTDPDAWATLIEGLLETNLVPLASWPVDTEMKSKLSAVGQARLKTSLWMACQPRKVDAGEAFLGDVLVEMRPVIRERLLYFWSKGIRGADFFISAIGPALSVFGRHTRVLRPDGTVVSVRDFLDLVRRESTQVALEQVLHDTDLGIVDPATRQYVTWVWSYSRAPLDAGEAIALCLATGADYREVVRPDSIAIESREASKKVVKLRTIRERGRDELHLGVGSPARPTPLIDQLQRAAWLWGLNKPDDLAAFRAALGETRWTGLRTLGQAVAESLPDGDEDRRLINGLLGSSAMGAAPVLAESPAAEALRLFE